MKNHAKVVEIPIAINAGVGISWKWLAGILVGVCILIVGAWSTYIQGQITANSFSIGDVRDKVGDQKVKQATTEQKVDQVDKKVDDVRKDVGDIKGTLQQILIIQQQQQIDRVRGLK